MTNTWRPLAAMLAIQALVAMALSSLTTHALLRPLCKGAASLRSI